MKRLKEKQYNSIHVTQSISKIVEKATTQENYDQEFKYLIDKCLNSEDAVTSLAASAALVTIIKSKQLQLSSVLSQLLSSLSFTKSYVGILTVVCELLKMDVRSKISSNGKYKCDYSLKVPQHPLISILNQHPNAWNSILNKLGSFYEDKEIRYYTNELMYAFYMYVICNPSSDVNLILQDKLWKYVIHINQPQSLDVVLHFLMWFPHSGKNSTKASCFLIDLSRTKRFRDSQEFKEVVILWLTAVIYDLIKYDEDPHPTINCLYGILDQKPISWENSTSILLVMLTNSISLTPSVYLHDLLILCKLLITSNSASQFALKSLKAALMHLTAYVCVLNEDSVKLATHLIQEISNIENYKNTSKNIYNNDLFSLLSCTNEYVHWIAQITVLSESLNESNTLEWLEKVNEVPVYVLSDFINCFLSLLLHESCTSEITEKVIELLSKCAVNYKGLSTQILILLMYRLSHTQDPRINFALLKAVPKMAVLEENLPFVLNILRLTKEGFVGMKSFSLTLHYNLWETSNKSYSHLQSLLTDKTVSDQSDVIKMEFYTTKAHVVKQLCIKSPERYGSELVSHLSEILNSCKKDWGTLATSMALEGITILCKNGIISIDSTWRALEPNFENENRVPIIKKICEFMSEINSFDPSEYSTELIPNVITRLFEYAVKSESNEIVSAAYNALGSFPLEEVMTELNVIIDTKLKSNSKTVVGSCWISLLENSPTPHLAFVGDFLIKHVATEISNYRKSNYTVSEGSKEPATYNYLPERSLVRALGNYLKRKIQVWQETSPPVYLQCLRVLSQEYSKILPPLDWCFLQELIHVPEARLYCITIASHQVQLSGTARRLMENYIEAMVEVENMDEDVRTVYRQLKYLCNSIQPMTLRPFVEKTLSYALNNHSTEVETTEKSLLQDLIVQLRQVFTDETLHEASKIALAQVIVNITKYLNVDSSEFSEVLKCVVKIPVRFINELSSPKLWKESSATLLKLSVEIRCAVAVDTNSLTWINEFIDETSFMALEQQFVLKKIARLIKHSRNSEAVNMWLLDYLNHLQSTIANENMINYNLQFLCDVFIVSAIVLAGNDVLFNSLDELVVLLDNHLLIFCQSINKLMKTEFWNNNVLQVAEWLLHMALYPETPTHYSKAFYQTLAAIRNENTLQGTSKWMRYLTHTIPSC